jgi:predicted TIM-barrel fold metal-dependent hydrolase
LDPEITHFSFEWAEHKCNHMKKIIDAHHHFWDLSLGKNKWLTDNTEKTHLGDLTNIRRSYLVDDFLNDTKIYPISKSVHIQAGWDREDQSGESTWLHELSKKTGFPHAIVAYADLSNSAVEASLEKQAAIPGVKGIRQIISWHTDAFYSGCDKNYIEMHSWQKNFGLLKKYHLSFDMQIYPEQVDSVLTIISRHEEVDIAISHALMPIQRDKKYLLFWREQLKKLSIFPHLKIKLSGIAMFDHAWNVDSFSEIVRPVIDIFSPSRCMVGSNFPVDKLYGSYETIMSAYAKIISHYSPDEQENIFHNTAEKFYRL